MLPIHVIARGRGSINRPRPLPIMAAAPRKRPYPFEECIPIQAKVHVGIKEAADEDEMERVYGKYETTIMILTTREK